MPGYQGSCTPDRRRPPCPAVRTTLGTSLDLPAPQLPHLGLEAERWASRGNMQKSFVELSVLDRGQGPRLNCLGPQVVIVTVPFCRVLPKQLVRNNGGRCPSPSPM